jgi:hypothetical protein
MNILICTATTLENEHSQTDEIVQLDTQVPRGGFVKDVGGEEPRLSLYNTVLFMNLSLHLEYVPMLQLCSNLRFVDVFFGLFLCRRSSTVFISGKSPAPASKRIVKTMAHTVNGTICLRADGALGLRAMSYR